MILKLFIDKLIDYFGLFKIIKAEITPGIQPHKVSINTIIIEPQPLSITARGGNMIDKITLQYSLNKFTINNLFIGAIMHNYLFV